MYAKCAQQSAPHRLVSGGAKEIEVVLKIKLRIPFNAVTMAHVFSKLAL
jgi:hypothetical protein